MSLMFRLILSFKVFDIIYATTAGGPGNSTTNLHLWTYLNAFRYGDMAYAMCVATILFVIIYILSRFFVNLWQKSISYMGCFCGRRKEVNSAKSDS